MAPNPPSDHLAAHSLLRHNSQATAFSSVLEKEDDILEKNSPLFGKREQAGHDENEAWLRLFPMIHLIFRKVLIETQRVLKPHRFEEEKTVGLLHSSFAWSPTLAVASCPVVLPHRFLSTCEVCYPCQVLGTQG